MNLTWISTDKHEPGREQPRNVGVKWLWNVCNFVWFLDSDCVAEPQALEKYMEATHLITAYDRIMIGPYLPNPDFDVRQDMFNKYGPETVFQGHLGAALACFSGNLVWPLEEFKRVGGFWNELYAGRCEDGELGIRACAMGVPMSVVTEARAHHIPHFIDSDAVLEKNKRDVPMLNARHPYIEEQGIVMVDMDGTRFDQICQKCGEQFNTQLYWAHQEVCDG